MVGIVVLLTQQHELAPGEPRIQRSLADERPRRHVPDPSDQRMPPLHRTLPLDVRHPPTPASAYEKRKEERQEQAGDTAEWDPLVPPAARRAANRASG